MTPDKVIYTDGRDVTVTDSTLKVKSTSYKLSGITNVMMRTIHPDRWPAVLLLLLGLVAAVLGFLNLVPADMSLRTDNGVVDSNTLAIWVGIALALVGILLLASMHDRYAVRIGTAEGEKNAVVSRKREYIAQIVDAIHNAFNIRPGSPPLMTSKDSGI
ncbi:MAG TPA: DUF6232 family protein [Chryseosolibacter sp.]|nr:DUF6232 family protein [Chryseosolibacter sp.]